MSNLTRSMRSISLSALVLALAYGCAGEYSYSPPETKTGIGSNVRTVERSRDVVWNALVPELGKRFFVINNIDKASGLLNLSYTGDPARYIDCGQVHSYVKNARGERTYDFPGSRAEESYEVMQSGKLYLLQRAMSLEGRMNVIVEAVSTESARVTVSTRYIVTRKQAISMAGGPSQTVTDTISFNTNSSESFPPSRDGQRSTCTSNGALETEILDAIK